MPSDFTCKQCGQVFVPRWPRNPNIYCSDACRLDGLHAKTRGVRTARYRPPVGRRCEHCGATFSAEAWNAETRRWCSRECATLARRGITGPDHPLYKPKVEMTCEVCGAAKMVKPSLVKRFRACSRKCAAVLAIESARRSSSLERAVALALDAAGEQYVQHHRIAYYVVDFFLPARNLVIECDGEYWHSRPQQKRHDASRDGYMASHGIGIVRLPEVAIRSDAAAAVRAALIS